MCCPRGKLFICSASSLWCSTGFHPWATPFLLYINDLPNTKSSQSTIALYADDAKIFRPVNNLQDVLTLQQDLDNVVNWSRKWQMNFNIKKCNVITLSRKVNTINFFYNINGSPLTHVNNVKDLGVTFQ